MDVLVVDDHEFFRSAVREVVAAVVGWRIVGEVGTGEDAVMQAGVLHPAVVLMDVGLPGITGIEATRQIVRHAPATTVLLLSAYAAEDLPDDAWSCGAVGFLRKDDLTPTALTRLAG